MIDEVDHGYLLELLPPEHPLALALRARTRLAALVSTLCHALDKEDWSLVHETFNELEVAVAPFDHYYGHEVIRYNALIHTLCPQNFT